MAMRSIPRGGRERTKVASLAATGPHEEQLEVGAGKPRENKTRVHVEKIYKKRVSLLSLSLFFCAFKNTFGKSDLL